MPASDISDIAIFDFKGLKCPLPVLKARRALKSVTPGTIIRFLADDPAAPLDFAHFCESEGHILIAQDDHPAEGHMPASFSFDVQKADSQKA